MNTEPSGRRRSLIHDMTDQGKWDALHGSTSPTNSEEKPMNDKQTLQWIVKTLDQVIDEPDQDINATELPYTDLIDMITAIRYCIYDGTDDNNTTALEIVEVEFGDE